MGYKCYRSLIYQSTDPAVIVLEDLRANGFASLHVPDDYETSKMIFQRLAVFHAASFYLLENVRKSIALESKFDFHSAFSFPISFSFTPTLIHHQHLGSRLFRLRLLRLPHA
jgi:Ecdysteroid kinase-like family